MNLHSPVAALIDVVVGHMLRARAIFDISRTYIKTSAMKGAHEPVLIEDTSL